MHIRSFWLHTLWRTDGRTNGQTNERRTDGRTNGRTDRRTDERTNGRTNKRAVFFIARAFYLLLKNVGMMKIWNSKKYSESILLHISDHFAYGYCNNLFVSAENVVSFRNHNENGRAVTFDSLSNLWRRADVKNYQIVILCGWKALDFYFQERHLFKHLFSTSSYQRSTLLWI